MLPGVKSNGVVRRSNRHGGPGAVSKPRFNSLIGKQKDVEIAIGIVSQSGDHPLLGCCGIHPRLQGHPSGTSDESRRVGSLSNIVITVEIQSRTWREIVIRYGQ